MTKRRRKLTPPGKPRHAPRRQRTLAIAGVLAIVAALATVVVLMRPGDGTESARPNVAADSVATYYLRRAAQALERDDYRTALALTHRVDAHQPGLAEPVYLRGQIYYDTGFYEQARTTWDTLLAMEPWYWLWWQHAAEVTFRMNRYEEALALYRKSVALEEHAASWHGIAGAHHEMGQADSARHALERALRIDSTFAPAQASMSELQETAGNTARALHHAMLAWKFAPENLDYQRRAGAMLVQAERYQDAALVLTSVAEKRPWDYGAVYNLGQAYVRLGRTAEGQRLLERAATLQDAETDIRLHGYSALDDPADIDNRLALAEKLAASGRTQEALDAFKALQLLLPQHADLEHRIAALHLQQGGYDDAIAHYRAALRHDEDRAAAWLGLGQAYALSGQTTEAREVLNHLTSRHPGHPGLPELRRLLQAR